MKLLATLFLFFVCLALIEVKAQQPAQANPSPAPQSQSTPITKDGVPEKTDPGKDYREMFDKLLDRAIWVFGVVAVLVVGLIVWLTRWILGQSQKDAKQVLQDELQRRGLANLDVEIKNVQTQFNALNAFKDRRVDWVCPEGVAEPTKELAFLKRAGLQHVTTIPVPADQPAPMLNAPDLVILSFNGSQQSKDLVKLIVDLLKRSQKEVPVLVYAPLGLRVDPPEMQLLNETALHAIANFPATLVTQALELVRLRQN